MRAIEIAKLAAALRANPASAERVAVLLECMAAEVAELEAQPVPAGLREPESARP